MNEVDGIFVLFFLEINQIMYIYAKCEFEFLQK